MSSPFSARPTAVLLDPAARVPASRSSVLPEPSHPAAEAGPVGYVVFHLAGDLYAVPVEQVGSVLRGGAARAGRPGPDGSVLVDVRGRTLPARDRRTDIAGPGDVLVPHLRAHAGLVVDRVVAVVPAAELVPEDGDDTAVPGVGRVLRPLDGGRAVLLVSMPAND